MTRTRAEALVLVNWKGVFYERYLLDQHVTALEGANGSGKTTVMIAAYIVLLPDMTRLRFTNLGESSATGGDRGIYGRLGDPNSASLTCMAFRLTDGKRLLAGVQLERRSEPTIEATPFVVTGLADDVELQDVLLDRGEFDRVPDINRLRELATLQGGRLKTFSKSADYFAELFDRGVTPLRLTGGEERTKFNEMLRTSMVGGISRALTGGLREFLLREESGLADTLKQMRANLDECRRTRLAVSEAQRMEAELHEVYQAGHDMFVAAVHATRERAEELENRLLETQRQYHAACRELAQLEATLNELALEHEATVARLDESTAEKEQALAHLEALRRALIIAERLVKQRRELELALEALRETQMARSAAHAALDRSKQERRVAHERVKLATTGLADFQEGLDLLHRRAAEFKQVSRRLVEAQTALPDRRVEAETAPSVRSELEAEIDRLDERIVVLERTLNTADRKKREFEEVLRALEAITDDGSVAPELAYAAAQKALAGFRDLDSLAAQVETLPGQIEEATKRAKRQAAARALASELSLSESPITSAQDARDAYERTDDELEATRGEASLCRVAADKAREAVESLLRAEQALVEILPRWTEARHKARELGQALGAPAPRTRVALDALRSLAEGQLVDAQGQLAVVRAELDRLVEGANQLERMGGRFPDELVAARDAVDGELLASQFEDVPIERAAALQAALGPLAEAIVVHDARGAAAQLATFEHRPESLWLVDDTNQLALESDRHQEGDSVIVASPGGARVTRLSEHPTLGRRARAQRVQELRAQAREAERYFAQTRAAERKALGAVETARTLGLEGELLERPDPEVELEAVRAELAERRQDRVACEERLRALESRVRHLATRRAQLGALLPDADLLDEPDLARQVEALRARLSEARRARRRLEATRRHRELVTLKLEVLRDPPLSEAEMARLDSELGSTRDRRDALAQPASALAYVEEHAAALAWSEAPGQLEHRRTLRPALEDQMRLAEREQAEAEQREEQAAQAHDCAVNEDQRAQAVVASLGERIERDADELSGFGLEEEVSQAAVDAQEARCTGLAKQVRELDDLERRLSGQRAEARFKADAQRQQVQQLREALNEEEARHRPVLERWHALRDKAAGASVLQSAIRCEVGEVRGSANLYQRAKYKGEQLVERLARATEGEACVTAIEELLAVSQDQGLGLACLEAWLAAREWLRRRVPPQIAEVDDPFEQLAQVRDYLTHVRERLEAQESNLRGQSEDVARNIETQRRKARREVSRLNRELEKVSFGSIHGVKIAVQPVESRERVLRALKEGEGQGLLFQSEMPVEEAMAELFKRYGGGTTGGQRLLDYREYIALKVVVRRMGKDRWEAANPAKMSTGEAIGIGAAIMMVVLTAWEQHARLLRSKRAGRTLRLLFLDEANRLDPTSLAVLFQLCQSLELQLIIAAPEVERAEGNTTYHLVRRTGDDGNDVVIASGRRTLQRGDGDVVG